jgi:hypothetical protein
MTDIAADLPAEAVPGRRVSFTYHRDLHHPDAVAGLRDMARQSGGKCGCGEPTDPGVVHRPALPCHLPEPRRRLTELEHTAAWHAIEGTAGEDGADPDTVLNAVLHALDIDPPA